MLPTPRFSRDRLAPELLDTTGWPEVDVASLSPEVAARFNVRREAIRRFLAGQSRRAVAADTGVVEREITRLRQRCLTLHPDGRIWGWRALLSYARVAEYTPRQTISPPATTARGPSARGGRAGAMTALFRRHPEIWNDLRAEYLKQPRGAGEIKEPRVSIKRLHKRFVRECRKAGIRVDEYPFNAAEVGRRALHTHFKKLKEKETAAAVAARDGPDAARLLGDGGLDASLGPVLRPFRRVIIDGHRVDAIFTVRVLTPEGDTVSVVMDRPVLLLIMDVGGRAALGYLLCTGLEPSSLDALRCIRRAVEPWKRLILTIPGLVYPPDGGFPSEMIPECAWACWDEFLIDNALAFLAERVRDQIIDALGGTVNAGPVATPEHRGIIERMFGLLAEGNFQRLVSTTGSHPKDPRRDEPERAARHYEMDFDELLQITEVAIAEYNGTPSGAHGLHWRSPLEYLRAYLQRGGLVRTLPESRRALTPIACERFTRIVRGNIAKGRRPHINIDRVRHSSDVLRKMPGLVGQTVTVVMDPDDPRSVLAYYQDGAEMGRLTGQGYWGVTPHTRAQRRAINGLRRRGLLHFLDSQDPIAVYHEFLAAKSPGDRRAASRLEALRQTQLAAAPPPDPLEDDMAEDPDDEPELPSDGTGGSEPANVVPFRPSRAEARLPEGASDPDPDEEDDDLAPPPVVKRRAVTF